MQEVKFDNNKVFMQFYFKEKAVGYDKLNKCNVNRFNNYLETLEDVKVYYRNLASRLLCSNVSWEG